MRAFVVTGYNQRVHSETGQEPQRRWDADGFLPRLVCPSGSLLELMCDSDFTCKDRETGSSQPALTNLCPYELVTAVASH